MIHEQVTQQVIEKLKQAGFTVDGYNKSENDYGESHYIIALDNDANAYKFRVSDHSVTNVYRMANEFHIHTNAQSLELIDSVIEKAERIAFPDRFEVIYTGQVIKGVKVREYKRK